MPLGEFQLVTGIGLVLDAAPPGPIRGTVADTYIYIYIHTRDKSFTNLLRETNPLLIYSERQILD